jgi:non-ribosomal peptide synthetase component F
VTAAELLHMVLDATPAAILSAGAELRTLETQFRAARKAGTIPAACRMPVLVDVSRMLAVVTASPAVEGAFAISTTPSSLCYLMYTSGSSGKPKACVVEHASIVNLALQEALLWPIEPVDRVLQAGSFSFDMALEEIWFAFFNVSALRSTVYCMRVVATGSNTCTTALSRSITCIVCRELC